VRILPRTLLLIGIAVTGLLQVDKPLPQAWSYAEAMKKVAARGSGRAGVVLHVGDSITYANPYGQWAKSGAGKTDEDLATLAWMHLGKENNTDGWYLASYDHPAGGRSYTACSGIRLDELLAGGKQRMPPLAAMLEEYRPQVVVLLIGTNDVSANRPLASYVNDMIKTLDLITDKGIVPVLTTIPPQVQNPELARSYNRELRRLAKERSLPLIDFEREILKRHPSDWNGTLMAKDDVHPSATNGTTTPTSAPTAENLSRSGYLLRCWITVQKLTEIRRSVFGVGKSPS
jgi:lysophospholipase L1-like esterase